MTDYQPVSCAMHSEFELFIMHNTPLDIHWHDENNNDIVTRGIPLDVQTRNKEEFLLLKNLHGDELSIRLDRIQSYQPMSKS